MAISLGKLAAEFDCELRGDAEIEIRTVAPLHRGTPDSLSFFSNPALEAQLAATEAGAVILRAEDAAKSPTACLVNANPYACYARIASYLHPPPSFEPGIHPQAFVADTATVSASAHIAANASVTGNAFVGEGCYVGEGAVIGPDCRLGRDTRVLANATLVRNAVVGERCIIHPGAIIGSDGFGNAMTPQGWVKVPQLGGVRIGNDVEVGANTTIDLGALGDTVVGDGVRLDNLVHLAHNVELGEHTALAAQSGIAGSTIVGKRCMMGGQAGIVGHVTICDDVIINGKTMITKGISEPGVYASGFPSAPVKQWNRLVAQLRRVGKLQERVRKLEQERE